MNVQQARVKAGVPRAYLDYHRATEHAIRRLCNFFGTSSNRAAQNGSGPQQTAPRTKAKTAPRLRGAALVEVASLISYGPLNLTSTSFEQFVVPASHTL